MQINFCTFSSVFMTFWLYLCVRIVDDENSQMMKRNLSTKSGSNYIYLSSTRKVHIRFNDSSRANLKCVAVELKNIKKQCGNGLDSSRLLLHHISQYFVGVSAGKNPDKNFRREEKRCFQLNVLINVEWNVAWIKWNLNGNLKFSCIRLYFNVALMLKIHWDVKFINFFIFPG